MTPEEYFKTAYQKPKGFFRPAEWVYEFAEAYLKSEVEAISDKVITQRSRLGRGVVPSEIYFDGAKWFKDKLLKQ